MDFITAMIKLVKTVADENVFHDLIMCLMRMHDDDMLESMQINMLDNYVSFDDYIQIHKATNNEIF